MRFCSQSKNFVLIVKKIIIVKILLFISTFSFNFIVHSQSYFFNNQPPLLTNIEINLKEDTEYRFSTEVFEKSYIDLEKQSIDKIKIISIPSKGYIKFSSTIIDNNKLPFVFNLLEANQLKYIPNQDYYGEDTFIWNASDNIQFSEQNSNIKIYISSVNDKPTITNDNKNLYSFLAFNKDDFTKNYKDKEKSPLKKIQITSLPNYGTLVFANKPIVLNQEIDSNDINKLKYFSNFNYDGLDIFLWKASDGEDYSEYSASFNLNVLQKIKLLNSNNTAGQTTANLTIDGSLLPPIANEDFASTLNTISVEFNIIENDLDIDGEIIISTIEITQQPTKGVINIDFNTGKLTYTPNTNSFGLDFIKYKIRDNNGLYSNETTITINISTNNLPPFLEDQIISIKRGKNGNFSSLNGTDPDNDLPVTHKVQLIDNNIACKINGNTVYVGSTINNGVVLECTPGLNTGLGIKNIYLIPKDSKNLNGTGTYLKINVLNNEPIGSNKEIKIKKNQSIDINFLDNISDIDGQIVLDSLEFVKNIQNGSLINKKNGYLNYTPNNNFVGEDYFIYKIKDNDGDFSNEILIKIIIEETLCNFYINAIPEKRIPRKNNWSTLLEINFFDLNNKFLGAGVIRTDNFGKGKLEICESNILLANNQKYNIYIKGFSHLINTYKDYEIKLAENDFKQEFLNDFYLGGQEIIFEKNKTFWKKIKTNNSLNNKRLLIAGETSRINDDYINSLDLSTQALNYGILNNEKNDINRDGIVNSMDFSITAYNIYTEGQKND